MAEIKEIKKGGRQEKKKRLIYIALSWKTSAACHRIQKADISHS